MPTQRDPSFTQPPKMPSPWSFIIGAGALAAIVALSLCHVV